MANQEKEEVTVEMTQEEKKSILEDLVFKGFVVREFEILDGMVKVKFRTITGKDQIQVEKDSMQKRLSVHEYSIEMLMKSLVHFSNEKSSIDLSSMEDEDKRRFISDMSTPLLDEIIKKHREFNLKIKACTEGEEIEKGLFRTSSISTD